LRGKQRVELLINSVGKGTVELLNPSFFYFFNPFFVVGASGTTVTAGSQFNPSVGITNNIVIGYAGGGSMPVTPILSTTFTETCRFSAPIISNATASTFNMTLRFNPNGRSVDLSEHLKFLNNRLTHLLTIPATPANIINFSNIRYNLLYSSTLPNTGANFNLKFLRSERFPDLVPLSNSLISNQSDFYRPSNNNSFNGAGTNSYFPLSTTLCQTLSGQPSVAFTDGSLTGRDFTINLGTGFYGVGNIGDTVINKDFSIKIVRFKSLADTSSDANGVTVNTQIIPGVNFPGANSNGVRSVNFNRPTVHIFTIDGKSGCYLKRTSVSTPNADEEAGYRIRVDDRCFIPLLNSPCLGIPPNVPTDMIREANEGNSQRLIH
jgi:hypothetical protein